MTSSIDHLGSDVELAPPAELTSDDADRDPTARSVFGRAIAAVPARPALVLFVIALAVRVAFVLLVSLSTDGEVIPDEQQYVALGDYIAHGGDLDDYAGGYGRDLATYTRAFIIPVSWLFDVFWTTRAVAALWSSLFGAGVAALTYYLARGVAPKRLALAAGLLAALLPSQILFSAVALRESMIWCALVATAVLVARAGEETKPRRLAGWLVGIVASLVVLGWLRDLTFLLTLWVTVLYLVLRPGALRMPRAVVMLVCAVVLPVVAGIGVAGESFVARGGRLAETRTYLSLDADSAFTETTLLQPGADTDVDEGTVLDGPTGEQYLAAESVGANLRAAPRGFIASVLRPFVWEREVSTSMRLASLENLLWYVLYALAAVGAAVGLRTRPGLTAFPLLLAAAIVAAASVSQGNVGTAFRHRGQLLWVVAVLAAIGAHWVVQRWASRRSAPLG